MKNTGLQFKAENTVLQKGVELLAEKKPTRSRAAAMDADSKPIGVRGGGEDRPVF